MLLTKFCRCQLFLKVCCTLQLMSKQLCILNLSSAYNYFNAIITVAFLKYQYFNTVSIFICFYSRFVSLSTLIKTTVFLFSQTKKPYTKLYQHHIQKKSMLSFLMNSHQIFLGILLAGLYLLCWHTRIHYLPAEYQTNCRSQLSINLWKVYAHNSD